VRKTPVARYEAATESYQDDVTYRPGGGRGGQQDTPPQHGGVEQFEEKFERFAEGEDRARVLSLSTVVKLS
jgi:hypothetical protein